ncbi:MAG: hypothetical protein JJT76_00065 [Clostridiaceae bacterium]|nr:hypothetical protein [Clostridiaceae bacterium]
MDSEKKDMLDYLLESVVKEEVEAVDVFDEDIQEEWMKLQFKLLQKQKKKKKRFIKVAAILVGSMLTLSMLNLLSIDESTAGRRSPFKQVVTVFDNMMTISRDTATAEIEEINNSVHVLQQEIIEGSIEDAREIVNFNFRELPYEVDSVLIEIHGNDRHLLELNYLYNEKRIRFTQYVQGIESSQSINVAPNSTVEEVMVGDTEYTIIRIAETYTSIFGSYFGVSNTLDINSDVDVDKAIEIISAME